MLVAIFLSVMKLFFFLFCALTAVFVATPAQASSSGAGAGVCPAPGFSTLERQVRQEMSQNRAGAAIKALEAYRSAALRLTRPEFAQYNYIYAGALRRGKKFYEAVECYRLAYLFMPEGRDKEMALLDRADVYAGMGFYPEAISVYRIFLSAYGKSDIAWRAHLGLADMLFKTADYSGALQNYEKAGGGASALFGKAEALAACGRPGEAYALFTSLAARYPGYMERSGLARYGMGEACRLLRRTD
nr:tetratricopeptide repeat protein [Nitrospiraceae bacterium]